MIHGKPVVLILNSAQSKYPVGADPWIQATVGALDTLSARPVVVLSSTGPGMWDLVTALASARHIVLLVLITDDDSPRGRKEFNRIIGEFAIDRETATPFFAGFPHCRSAKDLWKKRDVAALGAADIMYPVSIRPGGRLATLLRDPDISRKVSDEFRIPWGGSRLKSHRPSYDLGGQSFNPFPPGDWLIHWTRAAQGPWPGEKAWEFYRDLIDHPERYVRSARDTLMRMLLEGIIRGSSWKIPGGERSVSFTSLPPKAAVALMRWRKRFVRYSFEPYGIAIRRDVLVNLGARPIRYAQRGNALRDEGLFVQSPGEKGDWTREQEWRIRGDMALDDLKASDFIVVVPEARDAEDLAGYPLCCEVRVHVLSADTRSSG